MSFERQEIRPLSRDEVRQVDARAISELGLPGIVLMENAGRNAVEILLKRGVSGRVVICAGKGNNGGDGFVMARHLQNAGIETRTLLFAAPATLTGDAEIAYRVLDRAGSPIRGFSDPLDAAGLQEEIQQAEWIVDALLGTGMRGIVSGFIAEIIAAINAAGRRTLAVDLPSGLDCDTGEPRGACVKAEATVTFVARKKGFVDPTSREWTGEVHIADIGVPQDWLRRMLDDGSPSQPGS